MINRKQQKQRENVVPEYPANIEMEQVVLGALLVDGMAWYRLNQPLQEADFFFEANKMLFAAISEILKGHGKADLLTVTAKLKEHGTLDKIGGVYSLVEITNKVASSANIEYHALILRQLAMRRDLAEMGRNAQAQANDQSIDVFDAVSDAQRGAMAITDKLTVGADSLEKILSEIDLMEAGHIDPAKQPISTGVTDLDKNICGGVEIDDYFVIGADSGVGKTAKLMGIILSFLENGKRAAVFSYEMTTIKLLIRLISAKAEISAQGIKTGMLQEDERQRYKTARLWMDELVSKNMLIMFDCAGMPIDVLVAKCISASIQTPFDGVFIDYMQIIPPPQGVYFKDKNEATIHVAHALFSMRKKIDKPLIVASQLRKNKESKVPTSSDLFGSQALENCASKIILIYRPEKNGLSEFEDGENCIGKADLIIAKNREGRTATERVAYDGKCFKFKNIDFQPFSPHKYNDQQWSSEHTDGMPF